MNKFLSALNTGFTGSIVIPAKAGIRGIEWTNPLATITKLYRHFAADSLYRNSIYLMLSTAVMAFFGFFFWIINARLFTPEQVGIATTLISVMTLISSFSLLGLGNGLIRYLPSSKRKNKKINTAFSIVALASFAMSVIYLLFINIFSPKLLFIRENIIPAFLFILFCIFSALNILSESVFIAYRNSKYVFIKNTVSSIIKLILPVFFITLGAFGIFTSLGIALISAFLISLLFLVLKTGFVFKPAISMDVVKQISKFSLGNYAAVFIGGLPTLVLPVIITNSIGASYSAYFYMDMMIANLLYIIPLAVSQSLFAEGSYSEKELKTHLKKAIKIISLLLLPAIAAILILGKYILLAFGKQYSNEGVMLLQLFTISSIFISINYLVGSILFIKHKIRKLILINLIGSILLLSISYLFTTARLNGIGLAWMLGNGLISIIYIKYYVRN